MKKTLTMLAAVVLIGCGDDVEAKELRIPVEVRSTDKMVVVPNTKHIDYTAYRLEWRRVNNKTAPRWAPDVTLTTKTRQDPEDKHEIVELHLSDLSFKEAFSIEFRGKGEGHTFFWRGNEYTTNLLDVIREPGFKMTDPFIEKIPHSDAKLKAKIAKEDVDGTTPVIPVDKEDLHEGGGDQGTTEE